MSALGHVWTAPWQELSHDSVGNRARMKEFNELALSLKQNEGHARRPVGASVARNVSHQSSVNAMQPGAGSAA